MYRRVQIIAEVKTQSPFGFKSSKNWFELFSIAQDVGDIISIHTDPRRGGSFELLRMARDMTRKPILAKGIHASDMDIQRAINAGADHVLVVGRVPQAHQDACFIEPLTRAMFRNLHRGMKVVWNSRDLATGGLKTERFEDARRTCSGWLCQASNIRTVSDIKEGADAVLVGSGLEEFAASLRQ